MESVEIHDSATLEDIVFENRNKAYGAFLLRKLYNKTIILSLAGSSLIFALLILIPFVKGLLKEEEVATLAPPKKQEVKIIDIPLDPKTPPPPALPKIEPPKIEQVKFVPLEPAPDPEVIEPLPPDQNKLDSVVASDHTEHGEKGEELPPDVETGQIGGLGDTPDDSPWMGSVSKEISFPEGYGNYINKNISERLRSFIRDREIKGKLWITMTIDKDGSVKNAYVSRGLPGCSLCNEDIIRIVSGMKWQPAEQNGYPVKVTRTIPISIN